MAFVLSVYYRSCVLPVHFIREDIGELCKDSKSSSHYKVK